MEGLTTETTNIHEPHEAVVDLGNVSLEKSVELVIGSPEETQFYLQGQRDWIAGNRDTEACKYWASQPQQSGY